MTKKILTLFAIVGLLVTTAPNAKANGPTNASSLNPTIIIGNDNGFTVSGCVGEKVDNPKAGETYMLAEGNIEAKVSEDGKYLEVKELSSLYEICAINVKGGDGFHHYVVPLEVTHIVNLQSPLNKGGNVPEISHFTVFYKAVDVPEPELFKLTIQKIGASAEYVLEGAVFTLVGGDINLTSLPSNEQGLIVFENLPAGTYTLTEIQAPVGYLLLEEPITVTVNQDVLLRVENEPDPEEPPNTGLFDWLSLYLALGAGSLLGMYLLMPRKKRGI